VVDGADASRAISQFAYDGVELRDPEREPLHQGPGY
jgi:hypothetical protein